MSLDPLDDALLEADLRGGRHVLALLLGAPDDHNLIAALADYALDLESLVRVEREARSAYLAAAHVDRQENRRLRAELERYRRRDCGAA